MTSLRRALRRFEDERDENGSTFNLRISVEPDELDGGFVASVLDMPGCISQGETPAQAIDNVLEAFAEMLSAAIDVQLENDAPRSVRSAAPVAREYKVAVGC